MDRHYYHVRVKDDNVFNAWKYILDTTFLGIPYGWVGLTIFPSDKNGAAGGTNPVTAYTEREAAHYVDKCVSQGAICVFSFLCDNEEREGKIATFHLMHGIACCNTQSAIPHSSYISHALL